MTYSGFGIDRIQCIYYANQYYWGYANAGRMLTFHIITRIIARTSETTEN